MGNGKNRSGLVDGTTAAAAATEKAASIEECDVGLGLRMQRTESFPSTRMMAMPHPPHLPAHHRHHHPSSENKGVVGFSGDGGGGGCGPIYCNLSNQIACLSDRYDVLGAGSASGGSLVAPRTFLPFSSDSSFKSSGGNMAAPARVPFTASQWQELERQTKIYKYMVASMPVPPQLLIPISTTPSSLPAASQSNMSGVDLRFSRSSDSEPWRCRRTDGKKWRCSRDVAPNQKYCERHAHKSRPRSRKPVELPASHNTDTNNRSNTVVDSNLNVHPLVDLPANAAAQAFQKPIFHIPTVVSAAAYGQPRYAEWFVKEDSIPGSTLNQQWQQLMQSSSSGGLKRYNEESYRNRSVRPQHYEEQQVSMDTNLYFDMQNQQPNDQCWPSPCPKMACLQGGSNTDQTQTTRHFIDSLSSAERERIGGFSNKYPVSSTRDMPLSSLTLSMSGGNEIDQQSANAQMGLGMMDPERESGGSFKSQWLNPVPWMGSPPGGPLGEALCLGISSTAKAASNVASPHGYSTSNSTTTSSCSKSSCEDSGRGLH